jgi:hypothetical protein
LAAELVTSRVVDTRKGASVDKIRRVADRLIGAYRDKAAIEPLRVTARFTGTAARGAA